MPLGNNQSTVAGSIGKSVVICVKEASPSKGASNGVFRKAPNEISADTGVCRQITGSSQTRVPDVYLREFPFDGCNKSFRVCIVCTPTTGYCELFESPNSWGRGTAPTFHY